MVEFLDLQKNSRRLILKYASPFLEINTLEDYGKHQQTNHDITMELSSSHV